MTSPMSGVSRLWVSHAAADSRSSVFAAALAIASLIHLALIVGVSFVLPQSGPGTEVTRPLEVMVLRQATPSDEKPEIADAFAQVDNEGESLEEADHQSGTASAPAIPEPEQDPVPVASFLPQPVQPPEPMLPEADPSVPLRPLQTELLAGQQSEPQLAEPSDEPLSEPEPPRVTAAQILASRNLEIAELTARIQSSSAAYANRPRRKAVSASTREYKYASYLEAWRRKVERVGNLNYPEEAKRHKMYGNLILHVAVRDDGSIERIRVLRSSGFELLDEAAIKIVELSAPFAPFPPDIRAETDILDITRTWKFLSSNRLGWEN